jgi:hypothetical protein
VHQPHEYIRNGTAKMLTLFHPASGEVRVKGVTQSTNAILHPWIKAQVEDILKTLPEKPILDEETNRQVWKPGSAVYPCGFPCRRHCPRYGCC